MLITTNYMDGLEPKELVAVVFSFEGGHSTSTGQISLLKWFEVVMLSHVIMRSKLLLCWIPL